MSANNIVAFEEQVNGTFKAYHRDIESKGRGHLAFRAKTMRDCVIKYGKWNEHLQEIDNSFGWMVEYGYVFELRAGNEANPS